MFTVLVFHSNGPIDFSSFLFLEDLYKCKEKKMATHSLSSFQVCQKCCDEKPEELNWLRGILFFCQEKTIERLKEQRDRDEREKQEEIDNYKKDIKDLKERVSILQGDLTEKEVDQQHKSIVLQLLVVSVCVTFGMKKTAPL